MAEKETADQRLRAIIQEELAKSKRPVQPLFSPEGCTIMIPMGDYITFPFQLPYQTIDELYAKSHEWRQQAGLERAEPKILVPDRGLHLVND